MDKQKMGALNTHAQNYVRAIMAEELRQRGFVSKNGMDLHWYRIIDGKVIQTVLFYTRWAAIPIIMGIAYSSHPLFIAPEYPSNVYLSSMMRSREAVNPGRMIIKEENNAVFLPDAAVTCPNDSFKGLDILLSILEKLENIKSVEACYSYHKQEYLSVAECLSVPRENAFKLISTDFMDEVVYVDDRELYPNCESRIITELQRYEKAQSVRKLWNVEKADIESLTRLRAAIMQNKRMEHLIHLQERANTNARRFAKKLNWAL